MIKKIPKIGFVSLGCPKNLVDSEKLITKLKKEGYEISNSYQEANLVIVNTCAFLTSAIAESLETIGEAMKENGKVIVTGCLGNKAERIKEKFPTILAVGKVNDDDFILDAVHKYAPIKNKTVSLTLPKQGVKLTPKHYSYLKISEGCNNTCTFCIIPNIRGKLQSRAFSDVMQEASVLTESGTKELLVISQDTSAYGIDTKFANDTWHEQNLKSNIYNLADKLGDLDTWIRLHYIYPYPHVDKLIPLMAKGKILPYLDIPLQHSNYNVLKRMKRPANIENMLERIKSWRDICPDISIRSSFIIGFPGETDDEFNDLLNFLEKAELDNVGCFKYSEVEGAKANTFGDLISEDVKQQRLDAFMQIQAQVSTKKLAKHIGTTQKVIVDSINYEEGYALARNKYNAPDVDGVVIIENIANRNDLQVGEFVNVEIIDSLEYDLIAE